MYIKLERKMFSDEKLKMKNLENQTDKMNRFIHQLTKEITAGSY